MKYLLFLLLTLCPVAAVGAEHEFSPENKAFIQKIQDRYAHMKAPKVEWVKFPGVWDEFLRLPNGYDVGFRSDGVVVWRKKEGAGR